MLTEYFGFLHLCMTLLELKANHTKFVQDVSAGPSQSLLMLDGLMPWGIGLQPIISHTSAYFNLSELCPSFCY